MPGSAALAPPRRSGRRARGPLVLAAAAVAIGTVVLGAPTPAGASAKHAGTVMVLSAGSLEAIMQTAVEPAFHRATGYTITDVSGGSTGLAQDIKGGVRRADVFWSAAPASDRALEGKANGNWVRWYVTFAASPLVLGYNPSGRFAATVTSMPWWKLVSKPGVLVGRTNPITDPKGRLTVTALRDAARAHHDPATGAVATRQTTVFTETSLVGRLQSGQLDVGFFYAVEASAAHVPAVPLEGVHEEADYTLTVLAKAPHRAAATALVRWLLSARAKRLLAAHGLDPLHRPKLSGKRAALPRALRKVVH